MMQGDFCRSAHLKKLHQQRKAATKAKVDEAILRLLKAHHTVNFNSVSRESGISKSTLYNCLDIKQRIQFLREKQSQLPSPRQMKAEMNDNNKDALICSLQRKIKTLSDENKALKLRLKSSYSEYYGQL